MKLKPIHYFLGGVALTALVAAARFAGGTPLDQTFTYQGQLRNAGQLVSGPVDLRITLWDSDTAGSQVGSANSFNAMQLTDGRFACGLNFGTAAFDGSNRWIQVEFRNPAGSGQYLALSPRDKITATPYALYALNGANGVWVYDTNQQSVSVMGKKVGIGTSNPTAALEVVDAMGGDDSVKLPAGSIGASEIGAELLTSAVSFPLRISNPSVGQTLTKQFTTATASHLAVIVSGGTSGWTAVELRLDGQLIPIRFTIPGGYLYNTDATQLFPVGAGSHTAEWRVVGLEGGAPYSCAVDCVMLLIKEAQ
jgi:hypothetical protein